MIYEESHLTNIVRDVEVKGQRHLVDVGLGDPTFTPIPLDFEKESPVYQESYLTYKFMRMPSGKIMRLNVPQKGEKKSGGYKKWFDGWWLRTEFDPEVGRDLDHFSYPQMHWYMTSWCKHTPNAKDVMFAQMYPEGKLVHFTNHKYCLELDGKQLQITTTTSPEQLIGAYERYFPMIPQDRIVASIENLKLKFPKESDVSKLQAVIPI